MIIITQASIDSENVLDEIGYAIDKGKRILPVLLENCEVPLRLRRLQYVDFTDKNFDNGVESAKKLLQGLTEQNTNPQIRLPEESNTMDLLHKLAKSLLKAASPPPGTAAGALLQEV